MEAPASERTETAAPTQAAGAKTQAASAAPGAHDNLADPPADWPKEGPFDDPTKPEKAYVEAAVRRVLSSKLGLAAEDDRVFAEAAPGGPASAADDKEAREQGIEKAIESVTVLQAWEHLSVIVANLLASFHD